MSEGGTFIISLWYLSEWTKEPQLYKKGRKEVGEVWLQQADITLCVFIYFGDEKCYVSKS